jgi:hypothetical protein
MSMRPDLSGEASPSYGCWVGHTALIDLPTHSLPQMDILIDCARPKPLRLPVDPVLWYMEATGTFVRLRRVAIVGDLLYVLPRYRWTMDDERQPNEGMVEIFSLRNIFGEVEDGVALDESPLRDVPELEDMGDYRYWERGSHYDLWEWR